SVEAKTDTDAEDNGPPECGLKEARSVISDWGNPTLRVLDESRRVLRVNSEEPVPIENEHFKGVFLLLLRVDDPQLNRYAHHFEVRQPMRFLSFMLAISDLVFLTVAVLCVCVCDFSRRK